MAQLAGSLGCHLSNSGREREGLAGLELAKAAVARRSSLRWAMFVCLAVLAVGALTTLEVITGEPVGFIASAIVSVIIAVIGLVRAQKALLGGCWARAGRRQSSPSSASRSS
ncbi:hypothetical protein P3T36_006407 [Kitasatospora sp. MAP12-15]|uniref:hypothetical protein n=1 Tax=unclassified Kitasatospora TaxID=2633591 RepID=UPI00247662F8|nr:hypothetical protein [Kitasatospora sp. MAP12-44]MDH6107794.1 hypothetical protein [Kitasatospora sp. MAP12-44]